MDSRFQPETLLQMGVATNEQLNALRGGIAETWQRRRKIAREQAEDSGDRKYVDDYHSWIMTQFEKEAAQAGCELPAAKYRREDVN